MKEFSMYRPHNLLGKACHVMAKHSDVYGDRVYLEVIEFEPDEGFSRQEASTYLSPDKAIELGEALVEIGNTVKKANEPDALDVATKEIVDDMFKIVEALKGLSNIK